MTRRALLICGSLAVLTFALYWRAAHYPFITYDDRLYVVENRHVLTGLKWSNIAWAFTTWHTGNWHPLTWLSLMLDAQLFGKSAGGFHLTNVLLHTANTLLLFLALRDLTKSEWPSAFVAALFAIHPVHVESVAWISERKDVLSAVFFFLALIAYARYAAQPGRLRYIAVIAPFVLGLLAKSMLVTLPVILLLLDVWPLRRFRGRTSEVRDQPNWLALVVEKLPLFAVAAAFSVVTFLAQRSAGATMPMTAYPPWARLKNALLSYERYYAKLFAPHDLVLPYPFSRSTNPVELFWAPLLLIAISFLVIKAGRQRGYLLTGWLWFLVMLLPVIGFIQVGPQSMADRYMYLPAIGIFMAVTWGAADALLRFRLPTYFAAGCAVVTLLVLAWLGAMQLGYWKDSETLFRHTLAIYPREIVASRNLARFYAFEHRPRDALDILTSLLSQTPNDGATHFYLAQALDETGDQSGAVQEYETAVRLSRENDKHNVIGSALNNLAWIRATSPDPTLRDAAEAVRLAERSCSRSKNPDSGQLDTLAAAYAAAGDFDRAVETAERAAQLAESANNKVLAAQIREHVDLFRRHRQLQE